MKCFKSIKTIHFIKDRFRNFTHITLNILEGKKLFSFLQKSQTA